MYNNQHYAYIVGRLRALETRLMTPNLVERMVEAKTAHDAFRVLNDITYLSGSIGEHNADEFQTVLTKGLQKMARLLIKMAPYPDVLNFLWLKYDFHNLKVILKARLTERGYADVEHALVNMGNRSKAEWEEYIGSGKIDPLTEGMLDTIKDASLHYERNQDPQGVDLMVDKHYLQEILFIARSLKSPLIIDYIMRLIDFTNLKTFLRCLALERDQAYLDDVLMDGGRIPSCVFFETFESGEEALRQALEQKMYAEELLIVLDQFTQEGSLLFVEKKITELLQIFMEEAKKITFGPEPIFAFFWRFENHLQIIRTILVGKLNSLPAEEIHASLLPL